MDIFYQIIDADLGRGNRSNVDIRDVVKHSHLCQLFIFNQAVDIFAFIKQDWKEINANFSLINLLQFLRLNLLKEVYQCIGILTIYPVLFSQ